MTYKQAKEWIDANKMLIGTETEKGMVIGDLVAVPVNANDQEKFLRSYILSKQWEVSIIPFLDGEMEVWAIDSDRITRDRVLLHKTMVD